MLIDRKLNYGRHIIELFLQKSLPFDTVLDVAAGKGNDLTNAKKLNKDAKLFGIEYYKPNVLELGKIGINVAQIDIECDNFPFRNESIDIIICNQIIEHVKEIFWIMHEISRILAKGGKLIIGVPNLASFHNRLLLLFGQQSTCIQLFSAHIRGFTYGGLNKLCRLWP